MATERVSRTNTPPRIRTRISFLRMRATTPRTPPRERLPVSPIHTSAGWALNQRKPTAAPTTARQNTAISPPALDERDLQVVGEVHAAADVGQHGQREPHHDDQADRQPVQPVGEVDRVGIAHHQDDGERDVQPRQVHDGVLEEGKVEQRCRVRPLQVQDHDDDGRDDDLAAELHPGADALPARGHLQVVVGKPDGAEPERWRRGAATCTRFDGSCHSRMDTTMEMMISTPPMVGRARLGLVRRRGVLARRPARLQGPQPGDHPGTEEERDQQRRDGRVGGAEGDVLEDVEEGDVLTQGEEELQHLLSPLVRCPAGRRSSRGAGAAPAPARAIPSAARGPPAHQRRAAAGRRASRSVVPREPLPRTRRSLRGLPRVLHLVAEEEARRSSRVARSRSPSAACAGPDCVAQLAHAAQDGDAPARPTAATRRTPASGSIESGLAL